MLINDSGDEFIKEERRWAKIQMDEERRDKTERRRMRNEWIGYVSFATTISVIAITIGLLIWRVQTNGAAAETSRINACSAAGGTWTTIGGGVDKMCIKVGMQVP